VSTAGRGIGGKAVGNARAKKLRRYLNGRNSRGSVDVSRRHSEGRNSRGSVDVSRRHSEGRNSRGSVDVSRRHSEEDDDVASHQKHLLNFIMVKRVP
jgi:hypothetical protein